MGNKARVEGLLRFHEHEISYLGLVTLRDFLLKDAGANVCKS